MKPTFYCEAGITSNSSFLHDNRGTSDLVRILTHWNQRPACKKSFNTVTSLYDPVSSYGLFFVNIKVNTHKAVLSLLSILLLTSGLVTNNYTDDPTRYNYRAAGGRHD